MALFRYEGFDQLGKAKRGTVEAGDQNSALLGIRSQGVNPTRLEPVAVPLPIPRPQPQTLPRPVPVEGTMPAPMPLPMHIPGTSSSRPNVGTSAGTILPRQPLLRASSKDMALWYRNMASLVNAGTGMGAGLQGMSEAAPTSALRSASRQMGARIMTGAPLSELMGSFPGMFTPLHTSIVEAGERGGFLVASFERLAQYCERDYELQTMIKRETWYPKLVALAGIFIPSIVPLFLQGFSAWVAVVTPSLIKLGALWLGWQAYKIAVPFIPQDNPVKSSWDRIKLYLPIIGKVSRGLATAKFCRAYGALYSAGVGAGEGLRLSAQACGNMAIAHDIVAQIPSVEKGGTLTQALRTTKMFPALSLQMLQIGEQSGDLDTSLDKAADFLETDSETTIRQSVPVLGIIMFLIVALVFILPQAMGMLNQYYIDPLNDAMKDT